MTKSQILQQLNKTVHSIVRCRESLDSELSGLTEESRGNIETNMRGIEKARDYLEDKLNQV